MKNNHKNVEYQKNDFSEEIAILRHHLLNKHSEEIDINRQVSSNEELLNLQYEEHLKQIEYVIQKEQD